MSKYAKLIQLKDNFISAAVNSESDDMTALWIMRAENVQKEIDTMSIEDALEGRR